MTATSVDLSDLSLWCNGFPDDLFAELRRSRPLFRHDLTLRAVFDELLRRCDDIEIGPAKVAHPNLTTNMSIYDEMAISLTRRR